MTYRPGTRVRWATRDVEGTVVNGDLADVDTFIAVHWDNGDRTFSAPTHIQAVKSRDALAKVIVTAIETNN
ncbi:hypothetical protein [Arthrobacter psychrochitiniphilus]|uniref:hypothetical protein n=1 Tax=Arthrobacter psychrochitiniphilus TaxID=291045 RepID=UPI003F7C1B04